MAIKVVQPLIENITCDICGDDASKLKTPNGKINQNFAFKWGLNLPDKNDATKIHSFTVLIQTGMDVCDDDVTNLVAEFNSGTLTVVAQPIPVTTPPLISPPVDPNAKIVPMPTVPLVQQNAVKG